MATKHVPVDPNQYPVPIGPEQPKTVHYNPNQYAQPAGPARPTAYQKIKQSVRNVAKPVVEAASDVYAAGAQARAVGHEIGQNPYVKHNAQRSGFAAPVTAAPRHQTSRQEYPGAPVTDNSVMHPGNRLIVMKCNDATGKCRTIATGISMEKSSAPKQEKRRPWQQGGLGGDDSGF